MFEEKLEQFSTIRHCEILADQMKTINLLEINYDVFQQKLDELQEAYRELDDYELKYKELISSSSSADQLMLQIIRMTIQHINKCHQEYLDNKWKKFSFTQKSYIFIENLYKQFIHFLKMLSNWIKNIGEKFIHKFDKLFIKESSSIITLATETIESKVLELKLNNDNNYNNNNSNNNNNNDEILTHQRNYSTTSTMSSFSLSAPTTPISNDTMMSSSYSSASSLDETSSLLTPLTTIDAYSYDDLKNDRNQLANNYDDYDEFDDEFFSQNIVHVDTVLQTLKLEYLLNLRFYKIFIDQMLLLQNTDLDQNNQSSSKLLYDIAEGYRKIITSFESLEDEILNDDLSNDEEKSNYNIINNNFNYKKNKIKYSKLSSEFVGFTPADWYLVVLINMTGKYLDDKLDDLVILENNNNNGDGDNNRSVENSSQVEVIKDLFKEIERLKDLFVE